MISAALKWERHAENRGSGAKNRRRSRDRVAAGRIALVAQSRYDFPITASHVVYHDVKVDAQGGIVPWYDPSPAVAYDHDLRLLWNFWKQMRSGPNGVPY